jgi:threonyl-tRNA synthetase
VVVGEREAQDRTIAVRKRGTGGDIGAMPIEQFVQQIKQEIEKKVH